MKKIDFKVLLPNVITLSGLSFGLSSIRFALESDFRLAIICILFAGVCDVLDGLLAIDWPLRDASLCDGWCHSFAWGSFAGYA